jgi:hypothetical protein
MTDKKSRQHAVCAARLPEPERTWFLAWLFEARCYALVAWQLYYATTGLRPRARKPKRKRRRARTGKTVKQSQRQDREDGQLTTTIQE